MMGKNDHMLHICRFWGMWTKKGREKGKYITFCYTLRLAICSLESSGNLKKIHQCSGLIPHQSNRNLCGGMGQRYVSPHSFPHRNSNLLPGLRRMEREGESENAAHIWLNNQRLIYLQMGLLPYTCQPPILQISIVNLKTIPKGNCPTKELSNIP